MGIDNGLEGSSLPERHDRFARSHRFERDDAKILFPRKDQGMATGVVPWKGVFAYPPGEFNVPLCKRFQLLLLTPASNDDEPLAEPVERFDRKINPLVRDES